MAPHKMLLYNVSLLLSVCVSRVLNSQIKLSAVSVTGSATADVMISLTLKTVSSSVINFVC